MPSLPTLLLPRVLAMSGCVAAASGLNAATLSESQLLHPPFVRQEELRLPSTQAHGLVCVREGRAKEVRGRKVRVGDYEA